MPIGTSMEDVATMLNIGGALKNKNRRRLKMRLKTSDFFEFNLKSLTPPIERSPPTLNSYFLSRGNDICRDILSIFLQILKEVALEMVRPWT